MKIGLNTDSLGGLSLDAALDAAQRLGIASVEFPTGAWSSAPHVDLDRLLESEAARDELLGRVRDRGLSISALTCNGNQLDPVGGPAHDEVTRKTIALAPLLDVDRVVLMSGLPGGPGDRCANWIVVAWPPEAPGRAEHQWRVVTEYWQGLVGTRRTMAASGCASRCTGSRWSTTSPRCCGCARPPDRSSARTTTRAT